MVIWDVVIIGAGPGGLAAAHAAAAEGARTIVLERAEHPRYKTCGGGLIGISLGLSASRITVPAREQVSAITFSDNGRRPFTRRADTPFLSMVRRTEFDHAWLRAVVDAGVEVRENAQARGIDQSGDAAAVTLADGSVVRGRVVIGADGSAGISTRHVGVTFEQQDLGLEVELAATGADRAAWRGRVLLDWGPVPGSYGWVFPKDDELTVGVIMAKGRGAETKDYLHRFRAGLGLADREVRRESGHLTRCRSVDAPLRRGRVLVVGDAAGLLEPWTREGISYALRSGTWAGTAAARAAAHGEQALADYPDAVRRELVPEMTAGRGLLRLYSRHPHLVHAAMATPLGWRAFEAFCRGELTMANVVRRRPIRLAVGLLGGRLGPAPA
ncbi:geranylgeranyl reductase family protein [Jidongwangia harbinensis]|uniref:geranylgeranyl reductase family protein n=1 Tax=Jidongwangia harbinensis TaxID=2878561 RepID=UPI001CDA00FB|nr:geranylgeranyl reductase family protein [Jidongwangia harbinensis]MCA2214541.1 geranylgeranyl reductase family protein [Jidongwangia harbinensis]